MFVILRWNRSNFLDTTPSDPRSPLLPKKAASDHLVECLAFTLLPACCSHNCTIINGGRGNFRKIDPRRYPQAVAGNPSVLLEDGCEHPAIGWYVGKITEALLLSAHKKRDALARNAIRWAGMASAPPKQGVEADHGLLLDNFVPRAKGCSHSNPELTPVTDRAPAGSIRISYVFLGIQSQGKKFQ